MFTSVLSKLMFLSLGLRSAIHVSIQVRQHFGHPECWGAGRNFERCCFAPGAAALLPAEAGPYAGSPSRAHLDFEHPRLSGLALLRGCREDASWDEVFFAAKLKGGCLACSTPPADLDRYLSLLGTGAVVEEGSGGRAEQAEGDCLAGRLLLAFTLWMSTPEERPGEPPPEARRARRLALRLLERAEAELLSLAREGPPAVSGLEAQAVADALLFDILGFTFRQARYNLLHTSLLEDYEPIVDYSAALGLPTVSPPPLVFDLGMSGGMDAFFFLMHGFPVVAVEANPLLVADVHAALARHGQRLRVLTAAVVGESAADGSGGDLAEEAPVVSFHIHRERPDFSALEAERVPASDRAGTVPVQAVTCAQLVASFGRPYAVKIDAEGADRACLTSLRRARATPPYLSAELPAVGGDGDQAAGGSAAVALVVLLARMGYVGFKLCRQTLYNSRTIVAVSQETNRSEIMVSRQGLGLGASGPFGEAAVDWVAGPRWRTAEELLPELVAGGPVWAAASMGEWFDLHARLPSVAWPAEG
eukprot:TRINITY_DN17864_c0_g1_i2.p1 TRINITY_DN17864_c0_g1~~TRINITY_DN17864_c0_g1_i2.p1  ORF type:complete len:533 (+),score=118.80 TRINITY_DN17864_c0_g1_i2:198-1796(+)